MTEQGRGPRPFADRRSTLRSDLLAAFRWHEDRHDSVGRADPTGWWRDPSILRELGPALAEPFDSVRPDVILGPQSRGSLLGALVATHLEVGLIEVRKNAWPATDSDAWRIRTTPPDYRDRNLRIGFRKDLIQAGQRVLFVDDWIATGGQALGARALVNDAGATWLGAAVIVDALTNAQLRRELTVRSLLHLRDL